MMIRFKNIQFVLPGAGKNEKVDKNDTEISTTPK